MSAKLLSQDAIIKSIKRQEAAWIDAQMKEHLPGHVYRDMHGNLQQRARAVGWLREHNFSVKRDKDLIIIMKGFKELTRTRMMLEIDSADLIALGKVCKIQQPGHD